MTEPPAKTRGDKGGAGLGWSGAILQAFGILSWAIAIGLLIRVAVHAA